MKLSKIYDRIFYAGQSDGSAASAGVLVPFLVDALEPASVLDVGCGVGQWCAEFIRRGVRAHGVDGAWVENQFVAGRENFTAFDFAGSRPPFRPALPLGRYDLVVTLEFLEHLPPDKAAPAVEFLTSMTDVVVAGIAVPGQGGTGHLNEQWPSYWARLFADRGFQAYDFIRPALWEASGVEPWYLQNAIAYFRNGPPPAIVDRAERLAVQSLSSPRDLVHPSMFAYGEGLRSRSLTGRAKRVLATLTGRGSPRR